MPTSEEERSATRIRESDSSFRNDANEPNLAGAGMPPRVSRLILEITGEHHRRPFSKWQTEIVLAQRVAGCIGLLWFCRRPAFCSIHKPCRDARFSWDPLWLG